MPQAHENNPNASIFKEMRAIREGGADEPQAELPEGSSPIEAREETPVSEEAPAPETPEATEGETDAVEAQPAAAEPEDEPIRLAGKTFKNQAEAFAYAEQLEREKELTDAHAAGIREALEATRTQAAPTPEPEDDFEQRFYSNPKETLKEVQQRARDEAVAVIRAEQQRESMWNQFLSEYPDIRRKDAERVLQENWETIGKMTDIEKAKKALAGRVRSEYEEIAALTKPRTALPNKAAAVSAASSSAPKSVTPAKKDSTPLSFAEEVRRMRGQRG